MNISFYYRFNISGMNLIGRVGVPSANLDAVESAPVTLRTNGADICGRLAI
jgi:hypothetical protein